MSRYLGLGKIFITTDVSLYQVITVDGRWNSDFTQTTRYEL